MQPRQHPGIPYTLFFLAGIFAQEVLQLGSIFWLIWIGVTALALILVIKKYGYKNETVMISVLVFGFLSGGLRHGQFPERNSLFNERDIIRRVEVIGRVVSMNLDHSKGVRFVLLADSVKSDAEWHPFQENILCAVYDSVQSRLDLLFNSLIPGSTIQVTGSLKRIHSLRNPGSFNFKEYYARKEVFFQIHPSTLRVTGTDDSGISSLLFAIRKSIANQIDYLHTPGTAAILKALLLDEEGDIDKGTKENFINSGTAHTLAVSGSNVAAVVFILFFLFARLPLKMRVLLTISGVLFFLALTGSPPVERAVITAVIALIAIGTGRSTDAFAILALSALIICLLNPQQLFDVGFQLSYSAVAGIIFSNRWARNFLAEKEIESKTAGAIIIFLAISIAAQLATIPLTAFYFGKISLISLPAGILVIPLTAGLFSNGILTLIISMFSDYAALFWAAGSELMYQFTGFLVEFFANTGFSYLYSYQFTLTDLLVWYIIPIAGMITYRIYKGRFTGGLILGMIPVLLFLYGSFLKPDVMPEEHLSLLFADVGQGDATLMKLPNGTTVLIDAGRRNEYYDTGERVLVPLMQYLHIDTIDYGFISHIDEDHYGGFIHLAQKGLIRQIYKPFENRDREDSMLIGAFQKTSVAIHKVGDTTFSFGGVMFFMLNDPDDPMFSTWSDNDRSVVMKIIYGNTSFLFTGDASKRQQQYLCDRFGSFLKSTILKVPHHGGKGSTQREFLFLTDPHYAVISAGAGNRYGHPLPETLQRLSDAGVQILRTDKHGAILVTSDGYSVTVHTED